MNKVIPLTKEHLKEISKKFYKIDFLSFCYVDGNYTGWDYGTHSLFLSKDKGQHYLDGAFQNHPCKDFGYDTIHFIRKILK